MVQMILSDTAEPSYAVRLRFRKRGSLLHSDPISKSMILRYGNLLLCHQDLLANRTHRALAESLGSAGRRDRWNDLFGVTCRVNQLSNSQYLIANRAFKTCYHAVLRAGRRDLGDHLLGMSGGTNILPGSQRLITNRAFGPLGQSGVSTGRCNSWNCLL